MFQYGLARMYETLQELKAKSDSALFNIILWWITTAFWPSIVKWWKMPYELLLKWLEAIVFDCVYRTYYVISSVQLFYWLHVFTYLLTSLPIRMDKQQFSASLHMNSISGGMWGIHLMVMFVGSLLVMNLFLLMSCKLIIGSGELVVNWTAFRVVTKAWRIDTIYVYIYIYI